MKNHAFTLIELLVVVLIIGILAAIGVPKYRLAVARATFEPQIAFINTAILAQERYYLANGTYADDWNELDINLSGYETIPNAPDHLRKIGQEGPKFILEQGVRIRVFPSGSYTPNQTGVIYFIKFYPQYAHNNNNGNAEKNCRTRKSDYVGNKLCSEMTSIKQWKKPEADVDIVYIGN